MKLALALLAVALAAGCANPPAGQAAAGGTGTDACVLAQKPYGHGATSCQTGTRFRCEAGVWNSTFQPC